MSFEKVEPSNSEASKKSSIAVPDKPEYADAAEGTVVESHWEPRQARLWKRFPRDWKNGRQWLEFFGASPSTGLTTAQMFLYNEDLKPVEEARRTWRWYNFVNLWIADSINVNSWQIAGTGVQAGLTWWETWLAIWVGYLFAGLMIQWTARIGSYAHISFPVACRSAFGVYGSLWPVVNRVVLAIIWMATQTWIMGELVQLMLYAIFGPRVDERIGLSNLSGTTVFGFVSFFIAWVLQLPAIWLPPHQVKHLFTLKAFVAPVAAIAFLIWTLVRAHGAGPTIAHAKDTLNTNDRAWAWINMFMSCIANYAALILNAPDFSRFARSPRAAGWSQGISIPISFSLTSLVGLLVASASGTLFGEVQWDPLQVLKSFVMGNTAGDRGGVFLISVGLFIAQIGTNICANSLAAGTDLTALVPRFMNIRRGGYVCAALALCICPWNFFSSGNTFTTYLSAYSIFLSSISGVIMADYVWLRRGYIELFDLYSNAKDSLYMYNTRWGCNWRGYAAYLLALVPNMPGFVGETGLNVPKGAIYLYNLNYLVGFVVAFVLYMVLSLLFPPQNVPEELKGRLMDMKAPWLEEDLYVEDFSELYRFGTHLGDITRQKTHHSSRHSTTRYSTA